MYKLLLTSILTLIQFCSISAQDFPLEEAQDYYLSFNQQQSLSLIGSEVAANPESVELLLKSAKLKLMYGLDVEAMRDLEKAKSINPYAIYLFGFYGPEDILQVMSTNPEETITEMTLDKRISYYLKMIKEEWMNDEINLDKSTVLIEVLSLLSESKYNEALVTIGSLSVANPQSAIIYDVKGLIYEAMEDFELAELNFKEAISLEPGYAFAWYNLGKIEARQGKLEVAKKHFDRAINLKYDLTKAYFDRALLLKLMGFKESALLDYNKILEIRDGDYQEASINRGLTKKMLGDYKGALQDLNKAIKDLPEQADLYMNRANLYLVFGYFNNAVNDYNKAISLNSEYAEAYLNRGLTFFLLGERDNSCSDITESAKLGLTSAIEKSSFFCD